MVKISLTRIKEGGIGLFLCWNNTELHFEFYLNRVRAEVEDEGCAEAIGFKPIPQDDETGEETKLSRRGRKEE
jgi:hypothetical protein